MIKPRIIVAGAIGKTGSVVVSELLKAGYPVRAMVHREPTSLSSHRIARYVVRRRFKRFSTNSVQP